jgi:NAD(P)H-hydrate epimerase
LGTGLSGEIKGAWLEAITAVNTARGKGSVVMALDIPSGLNANTGAVLGASVIADCCITFIGMKQGMFTGAGQDYCGDIIFSNLDVSANVYESIEPAARRLRQPDVESVIQPRKNASNKSDFGHVLVVGGDHGMSGAARLAGEAAARTGAGLISLATRQDHAASIASAIPELMCHGVEDIKRLVLLLQRATVIAIGPGLGQGRWSQILFSAIVNNPLPRPIPMVVDADALNILAGKPSRRDDWILTPHPGEAARMLGITVEEIQDDRFHAITELQKKYGGVVVLKGSGTLVINSQNEIAVCCSGNPGMASGGMGDVLTGIIAGLLAQGVSLDNAASLGVCLHAGAGDLAARDGQRGLLASDLIPVLRHIMG